MNTTRTLRRVAVIAALAALLAACGDGMKGRYEGEGMLLDGQAIVFHGNGTATQEDDEKLAALEQEAETLRAELAGLNE